MKQIVITVRAMIIHNGQLLMCRHNEPNRDFYNLPGGKLLINEAITDGLVREIFEETGVQPQISHLMFINQFIDAHNHRVEFFFGISNGADYAQFNPAAASHAHEVSNFELGDPRDSHYHVQPRWLAEQWSDIVQNPDRFRATIITSS